MSFYGNMYLEFQKFFYRLLCQGKGFNVSKFTNELMDQNKYITDTNILSIEPQSTHDEFVLDTANRWIRIIPHTSNDGNVDGVSLFHAEAKDSDGKSILLDTIKLNEEKTGDETQLKFGDSIAAHTLKFDEAGHISQAILQNYMLPNMMIEIGKSEDKGDSLNGLFKFIPGDDWITLTSKDDAITIGHKDAEELQAGSVVSWENLGEEKPDGLINNVDTGSYFAVPQFTYDDRGHITKVESKYYKLPIVEVEAETKALRDDMDTLMNTVSTHGTNISLNANNIIMLQERDNELQEKDAELNNKIGSVNKLNTSLTDTSLTSIIGDIKSYSQAIGELNSAYENRELTVSEGMKALGSIIKNLSERIGTYDSAITGLQAQIDALKG